MYYNAELKVPSLFDIKYLSINLGQEVKESVEDGVGEDGL